MSKVFVIPDIHLKPWMLKKSEQIIKKNNFDKIVMLGDIVDDWEQERNLKLYQETLEAVLKFVNQHQNTYICYGNHEMAYFWEILASGYSGYMHEVVIDGMTKIYKALPKEQVAFVFRFDNVLFSHAGLTESFVRKHFARDMDADFDYMIKYINSMRSTDMWNDDSPIWARPQKEYDNKLIYPPDMLQIVGHSPVKKVTQEGNLLSVDTASTRSNGKPIGNKEFIWVDTVRKEYHVCK